MEQIKKSNDYRTGDLLLFCGKSWISKFIEWGTDSEYSHVAMILNNPTYIDETLQGLYIIEANHYKNNNIEKIFDGVQIRPFDVIYDRKEKIYWRPLKCDRNADFYKHIETSIEKIRNKPYDIDPIDWIESEINLLLDSKKIGRYFVKREDKFFCSAMVGYLYVHLGLIDKDMDWSVITPRFFGENLELTTGELLPIIEISNDN